MLGTPPDGTGKKYSLLRTPSRNLRNTSSVLAVWKNKQGDLFTCKLFWGRLSPNLLQAAGGIPALENFIAEAINRMVSAQLEPTVHLKHLLRDLPNEKSPHAAFFKPHHPVREKKKKILSRFPANCRFRQHSPTHATLLQEKNRKNLLSTSTRGAFTRPTHPNPIS